MICFQKRNLPIFLFIFSILAFVVPAFGIDNAENTGTSTVAPSHYFTAKYFHNANRCQTCCRIEPLSAEAIHKHFPKELQNKTLIWRAVDVDEPENQHKTSDYQLYTKSLSISEVKYGKEIRWKNLEKVWNFVRDQKAFKGYVTS